MFTQADVTEAITHYLTAVEACKKIYDAVSTLHKPRFQIITLNMPHHQAFGLLNIGD